MLPGFCSLLFCTPGQELLNKRRLFSSLTVPFEWQAEMFRQKSPPQYSGLKANPAIINPQELRPER